MGQSSTRVTASPYVSDISLCKTLEDTANFDAALAHRVSERAETFVKDIRSTKKAGLMEVFLAEYGLSTDEGVALMCLAEALLRVPDPATIDALIEDKIAASDWSSHLGHSTSPLVNASTWALVLTGKVLDEQSPGVIGHLRNVAKRLGEPVIRRAVAQAMREMGRQFVLGETIESAMERAKGMEAKGYCYSYDMLGEAAKTRADAERYHLSYSQAITAISKACSFEDIRQNPGISVKLSALHPRYELAQKKRVMSELVPRLSALVHLAKSAHMGLNIDAEEADRLELSLDVIEATLKDPALAGWDGFGVVVQAYGKSAGAVIDHLYDLAIRLDRKIMIRLVKGAYWDTEIKCAQVKGLAEFPVFETKSMTDISYIANARKLLSMNDRIYPQFATHNAHTVAAVLEMASADAVFEFQRLHGMGEALYEQMRRSNSKQCRIYAPVGAHRDLLAYLVRRLLENGANSSFVHQIMDKTVDAQVICENPFTKKDQMASALMKGTELFAPARKNSIGFDLSDANTLSRIENAISAHKTRDFTPLKHNVSDAERTAVFNPADPRDHVGDVVFSSAKTVSFAISKAAIWSATSADRARILNASADLFEKHYAEIFALLIREAGKTLPDALAELRETVDFLRYYASLAPDTPPVGVFACISPWNFPMAIFCGQISAALAAGNAVIAKPAEQTPLIAAYIVDLMHQAGVPQDVLWLVQGAADVGSLITSDPRVQGVVFTGSTETANIIRRSMANHLPPQARLIAETGGLNAMIVDSTALLEQAVTAVIESAFQSAGQRCSALRCLYVQKDIAPEFKKMLIGAMKELCVGNPWRISTDIGPVIDAEAYRNISNYIEQAKLEGRVLCALDVPDQGFFIPPTLIAIRGIADLSREIFGPVLHMAEFAAKDLEEIVQDINATGYGLTFGLQTRIDDRVQFISETLAAGNIYVNRNQIGAIVGSQPFGGEGLSGTGPKAGGPWYLSRFISQTRPAVHERWGNEETCDDLQNRLNSLVLSDFRDETALPGPTGELNLLSHHTRAPILCAGPGKEAAQAQYDSVCQLGGTALPTQGFVHEQSLVSLFPIGGVVWWGDDDQAIAYASALADREGPIVPLILTHPQKADVLLERHVCIDTTASGGNTDLLNRPS